MGIFSLAFEIQPVKAFNIGSDYTFTSNIYEPIVVTADNIIIDGAGYTVQGTGSGTGIDLSDRNNVTLKNVEVTNFAYGIYLNSSSNNNIIGNTASSNNDTGIHLESSSNNTVTGNTASTNKYGIWLYSSCDNNTLSDNTASNNDYGIVLSYSNDNTLSGNNASNSWAGIWLYSSSDNTLSGNTVSSNSWAGIYIYSSSDNTLSGNTASTNTYGIFLYSSSDNNTLSDNTVSSNNANGIRLYTSSNNVLEGNTASTNKYGIDLWYSSDNVLFHNNLVGNTVHARVTTGYVNQWDDVYPLGGNYWSNYTGVDLDHDGIGDTEHVIDANNADDYPLMGMFSDFKATSEYHVQTICNSSISDFQFNETAICFNVTGENDTTGFCRICVPKALMNETYQVFVNGTEVQCNLLPCSTTTHSYLYFTYNLSTQEVIIIPEFPSFLILPLFMAATLLAVIIVRRKHRANLRVPA